jgi:uncharacterized protein YjiS (DUF1127 family)
MTSPEVGDFFLRHGLLRDDAFLERKLYDHGVRVGPDLLALSERDLEDVGVSSSFKRRQILKLIMQDTVSLSSVSPVQQFPVARAAMSSSPIRIISLTQRRQEQRAALLRFLMCSVAICILAVYGSFIVAFVAQLVPKLWLLPALVEEVIGYVAACSAAAAAIAGALSEARKLWSLVFVQRT